MFDPMLCLLSFSCQVSMKLTQNFFFTESPTWTTGSSTWSGLLLSPLPAAVTSATKLQWSLLQRVSPFMALWHRLWLLNIFIDFNHNIFHLMASSGWNFLVVWLLLSRNNSFSRYQTTYTNVQLQFWKSLYCFYLKQKNKLVTDAKVT